MKVKAVSLGLLFYCCSYACWYYLRIRMLTIVFATILTIVIFVIVASVTQPLMNKLKKWLSV